MIFVTGASGYIGKHLIKRLREQGIPHKAYSKPLSNFCGGCIFKDVDTIVHLAQLKDRLESIRKPTVYMRRNVLDTYRLILYANNHKVKRFVYISSAAVYDDNSPYALTKKICEYLVNHVFNGIKVILRVFNVYGGDGSNSVIDKFQRDAELVVHGDGLQIRDFIHIDQVVDTILEVCRTKRYTLEDVGSGRGVQILELAKSYRKPWKFAPDVDSGVAYSVATL